MKLCNDHSYFVFPAYGTAFRNMMPWLAQWQRAFRGDHRFWHGFNGGGILSVPNSIPIQSRYRLAMSGYPSKEVCYPSKKVYGMVLGNKAGEELAELLACAQEDRPPAFAVKMGMAKRIPDPTVTTTAEHLELLGEDRILLVVPRARRKRLKLIENLPDWFASFDVHVDKNPCDVAQTLGDGISDWFSDPTRKMFAFRVTGGVENAAWQTAVVYYVAEYWDTQASGLDSMHFVACIDGAPCFRRNWTSNK